MPCLFIIPWLWRRHSLRWYNVKLDNLRTWDAADAEQKAELTLKTVDGVWKRDSEPDPLAWLVG
jgi:hypothetical protein